MGDLFKIINQVGEKPGSILIITGDLIKVDKQG